MRNKYKPFFYDEKKTPFSRILLTILIITVIAVFACMQVPGIRQVIVEPLYAAGSFLVNGAKDFFDATRMAPKEEIKPQVYEPLDLPDTQVLFAEDLDSLSALNAEDPLAALRQTPTPSEYSRVAEWQYLDPNLNYAIQGGAENTEENADIHLIPPVFEHADLFNDGPAILSAAFRYWNIVENQYHIAEVIHPTSQDPGNSFSELQSYTEAAHPEMMTITRLNGNADILIRLLQKGFPVILRVRFRSPYAFWPNDDRVVGRFILLLGYNAEEKTFFYQDTVSGNNLSIAEDQLLADWYPFQRTYLILYPGERDDEIRETLSENYFDELNRQQAEEKFRTDSNILTDNPFAQYNYALILERGGDHGGAWERFQMAEEAGLPQRCLNYDTTMLQTALTLGYADDIDRLTAPLLRRNGHDETLIVYSGWAEVLRGNADKGTELFEKAGKINPDNEFVLYALKYKDTMLQ